MSMGCEHSCSQRKSSGRDGLEMATIEVYRNWSAEPRLSSRVRLGTENTERVLTAAFTISMKVDV